MRISEFCKKFNITHQAVYDKMKNHAAELEGHITKDERNVLDLDPFAVELLKPKRETYKAVDERNYYLFNKNKEIVAENEQFRAERDELASKMSGYEAVIEYLKKENKEYADSVALLTQECERYKKECADAKALYKVMESEFDKEKAELTAEIKETEFGRKLLASTVSDQCKKLDEKDNRIHQLYKKSDEQEDTIERLNRELSKMTEKYNRAEKQIAELLEEKRQAEERLAEVQSADKSNATKQNSIFKHIFGQDKK
jgi:chromosome segregation ATPase